MIFQTWWESLTKSERKLLGEPNARFVWEEAQKAALSILEDACKAQNAYDSGYADARAKYLLHVGAYTMVPGSMPGTIWITNSMGEGGAFPTEELASVIHNFFDQRF